ncbi:MAG: 50S ribosomal protein L22, partial [Dehalococcoidia bacterium]|nr:50S ribosomal protein L22 [Dehalococcoidia bacterium]
MKVRAISRDVGISPQKVRLVVDLVRGKSVEEALTILKFIPTPAAKAVAKTIKSAAANAENNYQMSPSQLHVVEIHADGARMLKRYRPQARGRISPVLKRASHITAVSYTHL